MMLGIVVQVVGRSLDYAIVGIYELNQLLMVVIAFFGFAYAQTIKHHVRMTLMSNHLSYRVQCVLEIFVYIIALALFVFLTYSTGKAAAQSWRIHEYVMGTIRFPIYPFKTVIPVGTGLLCIQFLIDIASRVIELRAASQQTMKNSRQGNSLRD
jgi:TRAP-type mannitol/chloroaromatic compound transport system permease small subunit